MSLLSPFALIWLGALPVLIWLWRLAATRRQTRVSSLVPFLALMRRTPRQRTRLVVNLLFWLQAAALTALALALAQPVLFAPRRRTVLVVVDTSASMAAVSSGQSAFERARATVRRLIARRHPGDRYLLVASAPVIPLTSQPTADPIQLTRAVDALSVSETAGSLATAAHIGRALGGGLVDRVVVVTDEPPPCEAQDDVEFVTVGRPLANAALVGLDAHGPLCGEPAARIMATVHNFSDVPTHAEVTVTRGGQRLAESRASLEARARSTLTLPLPAGADGWVEVALSSPRDSLPSDNRAHVHIASAVTTPVAVVSDNPAFRRIMGEWLGACQGLAWSEGLPPQGRPPAVVVTDREVAADTAVAGLLRFVRADASSPVTLAHWMVAEDHPIGAFLSAVEPVAAASTAAAAPFSSGEPVVWGLAQGQRVVLVSAGVVDGRKTVSIMLDPAASPASTPLLVVFLNSLRWLTASADVVQTGDPITLSFLAPGAVTVRRPDGAVEHLMHEGGAFRYDATTRAGAYRLRFGGEEITRAANFLDPIESNLMERASTWQPLPQQAAAGAPAKVRIPLTLPLLLLVLALLAAEWWLYRAKRRA